MMRLAWVPVLLVAASQAAQAAQAQEMDHSHMDHSHMDHSQMNHVASGHQTMASGSSLLPAIAPPAPGLHFATTSGWNIMLHGFASGQYTKASGPRGDDETYITSMAMAMGTKDLGRATLSLRSMVSLEPYLPARGYPNLFATGETAGGQPLVDRQHPHDFVMELAARVDLPLGRGIKGFVYGGPVGEPALGPTAFMMRPSAAINPEPPISHHWFDSTHITYGVLTAGLASITHGGGGHGGGAHANKASRWQIEASAFRGQEPDEARWNIETPRLDSWSARASFAPGPRWLMQVSHGRIKSPEKIHAGESEERTTASLHYGASQLAAMLAYARKARHHGDELAALLAEASWRPTRHDDIFARAEYVRNDELFPSPQSPLHDQPFSIGKFQIGYGRRVPLGPVTLALGGSLATYAKPAALNASYGRHPVSYTLFARVMLGR